MSEDEKPPVSLKGPSGNKRRQQIMVGGTIALVLIGYLTYRKAKTGSGGGTVSPVSTPAPVAPLVNPTTATNVPSGAPQPQTTVPYAAPTDTTGGGSIPQTSGTPVMGAPSGTMPTLSPQVAPPAPPKQAVTPTPHPASHPALIAPVVKPHPTGAAIMPGAPGAAPVTSTVHPATVSGQ